GGKWKVGERKLADHLDVEWHTLGDGFTWESTDLDETAAKGRHAWEVARAKLSSGDYDLLILDELTYAVTYGWVTVDDVVSGLRKTTVATGLMSALARRGVAVASAKVGPDFIDPGYHALATGRPARNLDAWICGAPTIASLAARAAASADVLVVEGVMGLFDGASFGGDDGALGSTAEAAALLDAPVALVVDAAAMSTSVAALVHGYASFDRGVRVAGVVLNRVGSPGHEVLLREALEPLDVSVYGALPRDDALGWRERHLGLVPVVEHRAEVDRSLAALAAAIERHCDVPGLMTLARSAPRRRAPAHAPARPSGSARVAVAGGPAFSS